MMAELPRIFHILGGYMVTYLGEKELDREWVELIKAALDLGISAEDIRNFLKTSARLK
jgi:hypothetical protein